MLQTSVLSDFDLRAGGDARKLFANGLSKLSNVSVVQLLSAFSLSLPASSAFFGVGF
jgi:hypothetical protein